MSVTIYPKASRKAVRLPAVDMRGASSAMLDSLQLLRASMALAVSGKRYAHGGDSRGAQGFADTTDQLINNMYVAAMTSRNWPAWLMLLAGQPLQLVQACGRGGDRTSQFVARQHNPLGGSLFGRNELAGWTPYRPNWFFLSLGINNVLNNVSLEDSLRDARLILNEARRLGTIVVWPTEPPEGPLGTPFTATERVALAAWNEGLKALRAEYPNNLRVPDAFAAFLNPLTGRSYPGLHNDPLTGKAVHLNNAGAYRMALTVFKEIGPELCESTLLIRGSAANITTGSAVGQYQVNPLLQGNVLYNAGDLANSVLGAQVAFGGGTSGGTATLIDDPEGNGKAVQIDVTYTSNLSAFALLVFKDSAGQFVGGENICGVARVRVGLPGAAPGLLAEGMTAAHKVRCPEHVLNVTDAVADGGAINSRQALVNSADDRGVESAFSGITATPTFQVKANAPQKVEQSLYLRGFADEPAAGPVRWIVSLPQLRPITPAQKPPSPWA
ncbi:MAG: SGNH/GDSL hydrolase family protein [Aquabacterium sp.]|uniref:SGNH/GDSL hydrolase family protein n=1 Tax=Aquabacterium sp. TaxID=1872578 RepID=UPI003BAF5353